VVLERLRRPVVAGKGEVVAGGGAVVALSCGHYLAVLLHHYRAGGTATGRVGGTLGQPRVRALDSSEPDFDEGQVGRGHYAWLDSEFRGWDRGPKILMIHHHLLDLPGTGRDRNILSDAGDILAILRELGVELVLSGHRHVPYVNNVSNTLIIHCGTVSSTRVRGFMRPSYNRIELDGDEIGVTLRYPGEGEEPLASGSWRPVANIVFHPPHERYVRYDRLPF
jgi:3',5'-cyclic AMP phosphodiesterase CpdA